MSPACLMLPVAWSARPLAFSRRFPLMRPAAFLALPLAVWALCLNIVPIRTTIFAFLVRRPMASCLHAMEAGVAGQRLRIIMMTSTMITITTMVPTPIYMGCSSLMDPPRGRGCSIRLSSEAKLRLRGRSLRGAQRTCGNAVPRCASPRFPRHRPARRIAVHAAAP